jgi:hypothetical protein
MLEFVAILLAMFVFPFTCFVLAVLRHAAERRGIERYDVVEGAGELVAARRRLRVTKTALLAECSEGTVDSARRVLVAARKDREAVVLAERIEALHLAEIRRNMKAAMRRLPRRARVELQAAA